MAQYKNIVEILSVDVIIMIEKLCEVFIMKNEQKTKKRKPLLRIGLTALISALAAGAGYFITGSITMFRDFLVLAIGADVVAAGIESSVAMVNKIKNKNSTDQKSKSRNKTRALNRSEEMENIPVNEQVKTSEITNVITPDKESTKTQNR